MQKLPFCTTNWTVGVRGAEASGLHFHRIQGRPPSQFCFACGSCFARAGHIFVSSPLLHFWPFNLQTDNLAVISWETSSECIENIPVLWRSCWESMDRALDWLDCFGCVYKGAFVEKPFLCLSCLIRSVDFSESDHTSRTQSSTFVCLPQHIASVLWSNLFPISCGQQS